MSYKDKFSYDEDFVALSSDLGLAVQELRDRRNELSESYRLLGAERMKMRMQDLSTTDIDVKMSEVMQAIREIGAKIDSTQSAHLSYLRNCQIGYTDR
jgi:hypothetical protein